MGHGSDKGSLYEYAFDAVWALALALDSCKKSLHSNCTNLMNFTYNDSAFGKAFYKSLTNVTFYGATVSGKNGSISLIFVGTD